MWVSACYGGVFSERKNFEWVEHRHENVCEALWV